MKKSILLIFGTVMLHNLIAQKIGIEHYFSYTSSQRIENSTLVFVEHSHSIAEIVRDNDAPGAFSVNVGRSFSFGSDRFNAVIKPMIGLAIGSARGIILNLDQEIELNSIYISTELEYFVSPRYKSGNYLFTWFESGVYFSEKLYGGFSLQADFANKSRGELSKGFVIGFSSDRWSFPVYVYEPFSCQKNIVAGVFYKISFQKGSPGHFKH